MSDKLAVQLSKNVDQPVIVILKSQHAVARKGTAEDFQRSNAIASEQAPLIDELRQVHAIKIKNFRLVNALAATVSKGELERLKANPAVAKVVPDVVMRRPKPATAKNPLGANPNVTRVPNVIPGACSATTPQLAPEGLALTNTDSDVPSALTARSLGITGAGVTVAWIADGIDPRATSISSRPGKQCVGLCRLPGFHWRWTGPADERRRGIPRCQ